MCGHCRHSLHSYYMLATFTAASHIEDLPIKQFPLDALKKLLKRL